MSDLNVFDSLPAYIQRKIDRAFDVIAGKRQVVPEKNGINTSDPGGGGFLVGDSAEGFVDQQGPTQISMADIPGALQNLDLAPDDEQVLAVFRNAATGWSSTASKDVEDASGGWVNREDWRSVCAVLLEHYQEEYQDDSDHVSLLHSDKDELDLASDDQYIDSESQDDGSDDDYVEGHSTISRRHAQKHVSRENALIKTISKTGGFTKRQEEASLQAFALFFPDAPPEMIPQQRIMIKDIQRIANLVGEKIKTEEVLEMIDAFSTSSDKSISLEDFSRIMVAAKLA